MEKLTIEVLEDGKYVKKDLPVPEDQTWLFQMLYRQANILKSIRSMLQFFVVILILGVIVQACNVLLTSPF